MDERLGCYVPDENAARDEHTDVVRSFDRRRRAFKVGGETLDDGRNLVEQEVRRRRCPRC